MATVIIKLAPREILAHLFFSERSTNIAKANVGSYTKLKPLEVTGTGKDAAEEVFDLTNNPSREDERLEVYGTGRSLSSGDVVEVDGVNYLCKSIGWEVI
jgi:hypothetical protein